MIDWNTYAGPLLSGAWVTTQLTIYSTILGGLVSYIAGVGRLSDFLWVRALSVGFIELFRGTSLLLQLFWLFFALLVFGQFIGVALRLSTVLAVLFFLRFIYGNYVA